MYNLNNNGDTTIIRSNVDLFYTRVPRFCATNLSKIQSVIPQLMT